MKKIIFTLIASFILAFGVSAQNIVLKNGLYYSENNTLYTGVYTAFSKAATKESVLEINNGKLNGVATYYYADGSIMETGNFINNEKHGQWLRWAETGAKIAEAFYSTGKKDGNWLIWDANGTKRYEMFYTIGAKTGTWSMWDEQGKLISEKNYNPS